MNRPGNWQPQQPRQGHRPQGYRPPARPQPATPNPANRVATVLVVLAVIGVIVALSVSGGSSSDDGGDPMPTAADETSLSADLATATRQQGICYGWDLTLDDNYSTYSGHSVGSNQGTDHELDRSQCRQWVVYTASVTWTSSSSESSDYGSATLSSSDDLLDRLPDSSDLADVGGGDSVITDDPAGGLETVVEALPLLMSEKGAASPLAAGTEDPAASSVTPPPSAGSDRWRDEKGYLIVGGIGLLVALVLLTGGLLSWRHSRRARQVGPPPPTPPSRPRPPAQQHRPAQQTRPAPQHQQAPQNRPTQQGPPRQQDGPAQPERSETPHDPGPPTRSGPHLGTPPPPPESGRPTPPPRAPTAPPVDPWAPDRSSTPPSDPQV